MNTDRREWTRVIRAEFEWEFAGHTAASDAAVSNMAASDAAVSPWLPLRLLPLTLLL